jgi:hypothetical protein
MLQGRQEPIPFTTTLSPSQDPEPKETALSTHRGKKKEGREEKVERKVYSKRVWAAIVGKEGKVEA